MAPHNSTSPGAKTGPQAADAAETKIGRQIVVFGTKGGIGKTVVATNLAVSLVRRFKKRVCLVDLDAMGLGDIARGLSLTLPKCMLDLVASMERSSALSDVTLFDEVVVRHNSGIDVLVYLSKPGQPAQVAPASLTKLFEMLKRRYDYVIIDGGKAILDPLIAAFDAANLILLVSAPDITTLYQTKWAIGLIERLAFPSLMVKAVLNRAESRGGVGTQDARTAIPVEVICEIPSDGRTVGTSINQGIPLVTEFSNTKVAQAFMQLAETLARRTEIYVVQRGLKDRTRPTDATAAKASYLQGASTSYDHDGHATEVVDDLTLLKRRIHPRLVQELDLKRLNLSTLTNSVRMSELRQKTEQVITNLLGQELQGLPFSHEARVRLVKEIADEALGLGPLEELLEDGTVTDILVNGKDQIYIERGGKLQLTDKTFISNDQVRAVIERIIAPLGRRIDESTPMVDARLQDGSRVNAIIPPLSLKGPALSIRKFARKRYTEEDLVRFGSVSPAMMTFIRACVLSRKNMIISGGTGSGKTTLLNIVSAYIPAGERIVTIEDSAELKLVQEHWLNLESRPPSIEGKGQISMRDLFRNALRMRPDRIVIGECRGGESLDMLQAMNTGHDGSMTTIHANSTKDVISRLDSMVLMSNLELPVRAIRQMIASAIHVIVQTNRLPDGKRKIIAISELLGLDRETDIILQDLFVFRQSGVGPDGDVLGDFVATGKQPSFLKEIQVRGIPLDASVFTADGSTPR